MGEFQGRADIESSFSLVAQPVNPKPNTTARTNKTTNEMGSRRMLIKDLVAFHDLILFPFRHDIGDATVRLNRSDLNFGH
jgi:hypothetical protein